MGRRVPIAPGARDASKLIPILAPDWDELDDEPREQVRKVALDLLTEAYRIYESKAKFAVVGQLYYCQGEKLKSWDPKAEKLSLGVYATETQAKAAVDSLIGPVTTFEDTSFKAWHVPIWHESAGAWRKARKQALESELESLAPPTQAERLAAALRQERAATCPKEAPNDEGDFTRCVRPEGHPGSCFAEVPSMNGAE